MAAISKSKTNYIDNNDYKQLDESLMEGLANVTNEGPMASSTVFVYMNTSTSNSENLEHNLKVLSKRISNLNIKILALGQIPDEPLETVRGKLGECVQSLRNLKVKIIALGETLVNNVHGLNELDSIVTKADNLFLDCCKRLHQIQGASSWRITQLAIQAYDNQFLTVDTAKKELRKEFPDQDPA